MKSNSFIMLNECFTMYCSMVLTLNSTGSAMTKHDVSNSIYTFFFMESTLQQVMPTTMVKTGKLSTQWSVVHFHRFLHSEIQNANCIIGKTCSDLVTLLIPAHLENAAITTVGFNDLAFLQGPYEHRFVRRPTG